MKAGRSFAPASRMSLEQAPLLPRVGSHLRLGKCQRSPSVGKVSPPSCCWPSARSSSCCSSASSEGRSPHYVARNDGVLSELPLPSWAHERTRRVLRDEKTVFGEQLSHTVGYTTYVTYSAPTGLTDDDVVRFYRRHLRGWQARSWSVRPNLFCLLRTEPRDGLRPAGGHGTRSRRLSEDPTASPSTTTAVAATESGATRGRSPAPVFGNVTRVPGAPSRCFSTRPDPSGDESLVVAGRPDPAERPVVDEEDAAEDCGAWYGPEVAAVLRVAAVVSEDLVLLRGRIGCRESSSLGRSSAFLPLEKTRPPRPTTG